MKHECVLDRVRYPNEEKKLVDDRIPYEDVKAALEDSLNYEYARERSTKTLTELEHRWAERQQRTN